MQSALYSVNTGIARSSSSAASATTTATWLKQVPSLRGVPLSTRPKFADLYFGKSDSLNEFSDEPDEFIRSFVNLDHIVDDVVNGEKTLVLGPKGTGKSALAWYLNGTGAARDYVAQVRDASELPLADIPQLQTGQPAGPERTVTAWRFILLCNYLELLLKDDTVRLPNATEVRRVTKLLRDYGFMGRSSGHAILSISSAEISIPIPRSGTYQRESRSRLTIFALLPYLEDWASNARSGQRHILMLDGLDSIFLNDARYDESMAALVQAAYTINQMLARSGATGSIVLLIRNDVFSRVSLTLPDSQKMRDDFGVELDWRVLSGAKGVTAPLIRLVNEKAARALGDGVKVDVLSYFPTNIELGSNGGAPRFVKPLQYLLNMTRHTPRDLLRVLEHIRKVERSDTFPASSNVLRQDVIREGVLQYSNLYFTNAIRNEFAGAANGVEEAQLALSALQQMPKQTFDRVQFAHAVEYLGFADPGLPNRLLRLLFFAGAIGNLVRRRDGQESYLQFYHRRDDAQVHLQGTLTIHGALCHAWTIPFST